MLCQKYWVFTCPFTHYQWDNNCTVQSSQKTVTYSWRWASMLFNIWHLIFYWNSHIPTLSAMLTFGSCVCTSCLTLSYISNSKWNSGWFLSQQNCKFCRIHVMTKRDTYVIIIIAAHHCSFHTKVFWPSSKPPVHKWWVSNLHFCLFAYKFNPYKNGKTRLGLSSVCLFNMM